MENLMSMLAPLNKPLLICISPLGKPSEKNCKIYDIVLKGGCLANSKHDFFSIKKYDIIKGSLQKKNPQNL